MKSVLRVVRIGHPARLLSVVQDHSLDALLSTSEGTAIVRDVRKDIDDTLSKVRKSRNQSEKKHLKQEVKSLRGELKQREDKAVTEILTGADVVLATNTSASSDGPLKLVKQDHFDLVVIDEAAQSLEAGCWIPLLQASRCVLAGDHLQLPPTILSKEAAKRGLEVTLMERLIKMLGDGAVCMLTTQYRMNETIMKWSSEKLYGGRLNADSSVKSHLLKDLPGVQGTDETSLPLLLIDTAGCDVREKEVEDEVSKGNEGEADIVAAHVMALTTAGLQPSDIAVIAPYNLQVELLRLRLSSKYPALEIKSVDGFQGREKEAVVISLVRSNEKGEVGFLAEHRRINVAITRARRHLAVVVDSETVSHDYFLKSLMEYMSSAGEVRSAHEYLQDSLPTTVNCYTNQQDEVSMSEMTGSEWKKKENAGETRPVSKLRKLKEKQDLKSTNDSESGKDIRKLEISGAEERKDVASIVSGKPFNLTEENSEQNSENNFKRTKQEKRQSSNTVTTNYNRENIEKEILAFIQDATKKELTFPKTLNSQQRFDVHSIAEKLSLGHESHGEGKERYIVVRKVTSALQDDEGDSDLLSTCPLCRKRIPACNLQLHSLRCDQIQRSKMAETNKAERNQELSAPPSAKPQKTKVRSKSSTALQPEEDLDKLLASFTKLDTQCGFDGCKKSIRTLGQLCTCCDRTFCLSHQIPEVHGCGEAAKLRARQQASKPKTGKPKALDVTRKAQLQRKLERRLDDMSEQRKSKRKGKDN
ncbi:DNA-binding protein SMUBP-2 [Stylophora pistillata]|uniref:DNA-binding protein SMUBP-2 n=1 Tax=Stylophora pistillata TaxID=50429 RepID=A0A2B4S4S4_STYPI|nr:DNA-binding protein SMUBP-2 [Stylophora pistillata]